MNKQVLIINVTRMGDLIQMTPLLQRLDYESPGVAIDVLVDKEFAAIAKLLPGIRHVVSYNFQDLMDDTRVRARDLVSLYQDVAEWAKPLIACRYDRVINLTFNRRSAYLTRYLGNTDIRGLTTAPDGTVIVDNPWMTYFLDMHVHRKINRFNLVDVYALGGSGPGPYMPVTLNSQAIDHTWANRFLAASKSPSRWIGVQIGASDVMKAWRPAYFGQTMALLSQRLSVGFVLIGTKKELSVAREAIAAYKEAGGTAPLCEAIGKTTVPELVGLLACCQLMLTNDTGPMHLAVGVGIPIVNVSVGHVDFRETGPYGPNHWVVQPEIECGPCGFDQVCSHQSCKERLLPRQVADVCLHALGEGSLPTRVMGMRVYESGVDDDQLGTFHLRLGTEDRILHWYGEFWRRYWYEECLGKESRLPHMNDEPPDIDDVRNTYSDLHPLLNILSEESEEMQRLASLQPLPVTQLKDCHERLNRLAHEARVLGRSSWAFSPITAVCFRDTHNLRQSDLRGMAQEHARAYRMWRKRANTVARRLAITHTPTRRMVYAGSA